VVTKGEGVYGHEIVGFRHGWRGLIEDETMDLSVSSVRSLARRGGTVLGTSRTNPFKSDDGVARLLDTLTRQRIDALIAIGGEDTLGVAAKLGAEGVRCVGVPKTIDNDLSGTEVTFGFDTAVQTATEAIDRLQTTAESHHRVIVCEVMGRHVGWIAVHAGIAGGAAEILIPEVPFSLDGVCNRLLRRHGGNQFFSTVVVAEGARPSDGDTATSTWTSQASGPADQFGHVRLGGIGAFLAGEIERRTGYESRSTVLGHIQRGGSPTAFDRVLATRFGLHAIDAADGGRWGMMTALRGTEIELVALTEATEELKTVPKAFYEEAEVFFG
jgi:6-phosphofructokinase 1